MKFLTLFGAAVLMCLSTVTMAGGSKAEVCHIPPGNSANFHTITVSEKAMVAHLAHGDLEASCGTYAGVLCDDGDMCTQDRFYDGTETCEANISVDTDDGNSCTVDSCDSATGNVNTALADGTACDDGSGASICSGGVCGRDPSSTTCDLSVCSDNLSIYQPDCGKLVVAIPNNNQLERYWIEFDADNISYVHGYTCISAGDGNENWIATACGDQSSYGPNMRIPLIVGDNDTGQTTTLTLKAQQNYCGLEAGDITFKIEDDEGSGLSLVHHTTHGSWSNNKAGRICICDVIPPE